MLYVTESFNSSSQFNCQMWFLWFLIYSFVFFKMYFFIVKCFDKSEIRNIEEVNFMQNISFCIKKKKKSVKWAFAPLFSVSKIFLTFLCILIFVCYLTFNVCLNIIFHFIYITQVEWNLFYFSCSLLLFNLA